MKIKTLADLMRLEAQKVNRGFCYSTWPYPCMISEALAYAKDYNAPSKDQHTVTTTQNDDGILTESVITIKPRKGSGKRKPMTIKLWWPA